LLVLQLGVIGVDEEFLEQRVHAVLLSIGSVRYGPASL